MDDDLALPVMDDIRACLCSELDASPGGGVCACILSPGGSVPLDACSCDSNGDGGCGQAWVRLVRIFPSTQFPFQDSADQKCAAPLAAVLELGVMRCQPPLGLMEADGAAKLTEAVRIQMGDWQALRRAVTCCPALEGRKVSMGSYDARSGGACGGGVLQVTVRLGRIR